jgi:hypothetical protein
MNNFLTWEDLLRERGSGSTILKKDGLVDSILFGGGGYRDRVDGEFLTYHIPRRKYYFSSIKDLTICKDKRHSFRVFRKVRSNTWEILGFYWVDFILENESDFLVTLKRAL